MKFVLIFLLSFFAVSVFSACGTINWIKDLIKNLKAGNWEKVRDSMFAFAFAVFLAPVFQLILAFVLNIAFGISHIPNILILFLFIFFLASEQIFYEWGIQNKIKKLFPRILIGILSKFGLIKDEKNNN